MFIVEIRHGPTAWIAKNKSTTFFIVSAKYQAYDIRLRFYDLALCFLFCQKCIGVLLQVLFVFLKYSSYSKIVLKVSFGVHIQAAVKGV